MIEIILQAERALAVGLVEQAERLYQQAAAADPRNSIAVVGLARVALERADDRGAYVLARQALAIDPENVAAQRLADRLEEVLRHRGEAVPEVTAADPAVPAPEAAAPEPEPEPEASEAEAPEPAPRRRSLLDRLLRRR